jgi:hypothetical protein
MKMLRASVFSGFSQCCRTVELVRLGSFGVHLFSTGQPKSCCQILGRLNVINSKVLIGVGILYGARSVLVTHKVFMQVISEIS